MKYPPLSPRLLLSLDPAGGGSTAAPAPAAPAAKAAAPIGVHPEIGLSAVDLIAQIESDPEAFGGAALAADHEDGAPAGTPAETAEAKAAREAATAKAAAEAKAKEQEAGAASGAPELTADQKAWLELRKAATTEAAAAEVDQQAPAFTDEQWALIEKEFAGEAAAPAAAPAVKPEELQAQLTAAQTEAARLKSEAEASSKRLKEIEADLATAQTAAVPVAPMNPLLAATPEQLAQAEATAAQLKQWALRNWDGAPAIEATATTPAQPAYTAEQVRSAYARADDQLARVIPAARTYHQQFEAENALAQQVYPELFDKESPHFQTRANILRRLPGLKAGLPQISAVIGDATVGETIRGLLAAETPTAETQALAAALVKAAPSLAKFMPRLTAPGKAKAVGKLPARPIVPLARPSAGGRALPVRPGARATGGPDNKRFVTLLTENGGDQLSALTETLRNVNVP